MEKAREKSPESEEFDKLFEELTGISPDEAETNEDGWLFLSLEFDNAPEDKKDRLSELAGPNGWKNHIVDDEYAGYWIRRPE